MKKILSILTILCLLCGCGSIEIIDDLSPITQNESNNQNEQTEIPEYDGKAYVTIGDGIPEFDQEDLEADAFEEYYDLDELGRVSGAYAKLGVELMPTKSRGDIYMIKPTAWQSSRYDFIDGQSLYNRCHLIAWCLTGENANENYRFNRRYELGKHHYIL